MALNVRPVAPGPIEKDHNNFAGLSTTEAIAKHLADRFGHDTFLVALNPRNVIPELYSRDIAREHAESKPLLSLPPHPFGAAELISQLMREQSKDQSIIFRCEEVTCDLPDYLHSGGVGSGKTTVHRVMLHYLLSRSNRFTLMEQMILEASIVVDAFSCARGGPEKDSSRMLKATELFYDSRHIIMGARIRCFYLELSRVTNSKGNFNVFYQLCNGASDLEAKLYGLRSEFELLGEPLRTATKITDAAAFVRLKTAMQLLGITEDQQSQIFQATAAIMHLGNLRFATDPQTKTVTVVNESTLSMAATLLGVPSGLIVKYLTKSSVETPLSGQEWQFNLTERQASSLRAALLRALYQRVFACVLGHVNAALSFPESQSQNVIRFVESSGPVAGGDPDSLVTNYINDKLHSHMWASVYGEEQRLRREEGLSPLSVPWTDPRPSLDLIEHPSRGLFFLLDELRKQPALTDATLYDTFNNAHTPHPAYRRIATKEKERKAFGVLHSFGERQYMTKKFLDKFFEPAVAAATSLIDASQHLTILKTKFDGRVSSGSLEVAPSMLMGLAACTLVTSVAELCKQLTDTNCNFVFCLSPSESGPPDTVDMSYLSAQVSAMSLASVCTFKDQSYTVRIMARDFLKRYSTLSMRHKARWRRTVSLDTKARIEAAFRSRDNPGDRIITKNYVFLKTRAYLSLENRRSIELERNAEKIQAWWRMLVKRFAYRNYRHSVILVQARIRRRLAQRRYEALVAATTVLTSALRMSVVHREWRRKVRGKMKEREGRSPARDGDKRQVSRLMKVQVKTDAKEEDDDDLHSALSPGGSRLTRLSSRATGPTPNVDTDLRHHYRLAFDVALPGAALGDARSKGSLLERRQSTGSLGGAMMSPRRSRRNFDEIAPGSPSPSQPVVQPKFLVTLPVIVTDSEVPKFSFPDFAAQYFQPSKGIFKANRFHDAAAWTGKLLSTSLLPLPPNIARYALASFQHIMAYQNARQPRTNLKSLLQLGSAHEELRDEIYCQLMKQLTRNPLPDFETKMWEVLACCLGTFMPRPIFQPYVAAFCLHAQREKSNPAAAWCLQLLRHAVSANLHRKRQPSDLELRYARLFQLIVFAIELPGGAHMEIHVDSATRWCEVVDLIAFHYSCDSPHEYSVYDITDGAQFERSLNANDFVMDTVGHDPTPRLCLKKKLFLTGGLNGDRLEQEVLYHQIGTDIASQALPCSEADAVRLAVIKLQSKVKLNCERFRLDLRMAFPIKNLKLRPAAEWKKILLTKYHEWVNSDHTLGQMDSTQTQDYFLKEASHLPHFSTRFFPGELEGRFNPLNLPNTFWIGVSAQGIVLSAEDLTPLHKLRWGDVDAITSGELGRLRNMQLVFGDVGAQQTIEIICPRTPELVSLIKDYAYWLRELAQFGVALTDYTAPDQGISFKRGDVITLVEKNDKHGWVLGEFSGKRGTFPAEHIQLVLSDSELASLRKSQALRRPTPSQILDRRRLNRQDSRPELGSLRVGFARRTPLKSPILRPLSHRSRPNITRLLQRRGSSSASLEGNGPSYKAAMLSGRLDQIPIHNYQMRQYARTNFRSSRPSGSMLVTSSDRSSGGGFFGNMSSTIIDRSMSSGQSMIARDNQLESAITYSSTPILQSLTKMDDQKLAKLACGTFLDIMKYMGDFPAGPMPNQYKFIHQVLRLALDKTELRDEVYCQLLRQTTNNLSEASRTRGWHIIACCTLTFQPSEELFPYVLAFLVQHALNNATPPAISQLAHLSIANLRSILISGSRALPPSFEEMESIILGGQLECAIRLADGATKVINIDGKTRVSDAVRQLHLRTSLPREGWALFQCRVSSRNDSSYSMRTYTDTDSERWLKDKENLCDVVNSFNASTPEPHITCYLLYKKFIFTEADPAYPPDTYVSELLYHQAFDAVIRGRLPVSETTASELAAITMQLAYGDFTDRPYYLDRLKPHVPTYWLPRASPAEWLARIVPLYQGLKGLPSANLRKMYMDRVFTMPLYGSVQMPVQYALNSTIWTRYTLAITQKGIQLIEGYSTIPVRVWNHQDIIGYTATPSYFIFLTGSLLTAQREVIEVLHPRLLAEIYSAFLKAAQTNPASVSH